MNKQNLVRQQVHSAGRQLTAGIRMRQIDRDLLDSIRRSVVEAFLNQPLPQVAGFLQQFDRKGFQSATVGRVKNHIGLVETGRLRHT